MGCGKKFQPGGVSMIHFICGENDALCWMCQVKEQQEELDKVIEELP